MRDSWKQNVALRMQQLQGRALSKVVRLVSTADGEDRVAAAAAAAAASAQSHDKRCMPCNSFQAEWTMVEKQLNAIFSDWVDPAAAQARAVVDWDSMSPEADP